MSDIRIKMAKDLRDMSDMVGDLHWMAAKAVEDLTKKDGEIAKRDEELAACRVAVENCEVFRARIAELEARIVWLECELQVNAAPVSEAKAQGDAWAPSGNDYDHSIHSNPDAREWADFFVATFPGLADKHDLMIGWFANAMMAMHDHLARKAQGVVMPEGWIPLTIEHEPGYPEDVAFGPKRMMDRLKKWLDRYFEMRLNAAHARQVSVPAELLEMEWLEQWLLLAAEPTGQECCCQAHIECCGNAIHVYRTADEIAAAMNTRREELRSMLAATTATPAAPAADAGLIEALETIINPIEAMRRELQEGEQLNGIAAVQLASDPEYLRSIARAALAAHSAKGVV